MEVNYTEALATTEFGIFGELPDNKGTHDWIMELDFVDLWEGSIGDLEKLARSAPTPRARALVERVIAARRRDEEIDLVLSDPVTQSELDAARMQMLAETLANWKKDQQVQEEASAREAAEEAAEEKRLVEVATARHRKLSSKGPGGMG
ncbi:MAG: hypothetical protein KGP14_14440 [Betaproteobacteria bacterium]|nr:hypothetical protein [Betaproteobacteria bacterium]